MKLLAPAGRARLENIPAQFMHGACKYWVGFTSQRRYRLD
jgi:hypothetical protein